MVVRVRPKTEKLGPLELGLEFATLLNNRYHPTYVPQLLILTSMLSSFIHEVKVTLLSLA